MAACAAGKKNQSFSKTLAIGQCWKRDSSPTVREGRRTNVSPNALPYGRATASLDPLLTEFLMLHEYFRVARLKEHQPHFLQLSICREEILDRLR